MAHFNQQVEGRRKELPLAGSLCAPWVPRRDSGSDNGGGSETTTATVETLTLTEHLLHARHHSTHFTDEETEAQGASI